MQVTETLSDGLKRNYTVVLAGADLDFALQPFSERFDNLHLPTFISCGRAPTAVCFYEHDAGSTTGRGFHAILIILPGKMAHRIRGRPGQTDV